LSNKRKPHPIARPRVVNEAVDAAIQRLRRVHPGEADVMLVFGAVGLYLGQKHKTDVEFAREVRGRLAKIETATSGMPELLEAAGSGGGIGTREVGLGRLLGLFTERIREVNRLCGLLRGELSSDAFSKSASLSSQPEVAMAAWASFGPVAVGDRSAPVPLITTTLLDLAMAIGVDSPTEPRISRKSRWENRSRKQNIARMTSALMKGHGSTPDSLAAQLMDYLPTGSFRDEVATQLSTQMSKRHGGGDAAVPRHLLVPVANGFTAEQVLEQVHPGGAEP
jgi:hypothetical protein